MALIAGEQPTLGGGVIAGLGTCADREGVGQRTANRAGSIAVKGQRVLLGVVCAILREEVVAIAAGALNGTWKRQALIWVDSVGGVYGIVSCHSAFAASH